MDADRFFSRLNPLIVGILCSPLHWPLSLGLMTIRVTGRRSGRSYTIPVGYQRRGDEITVLVSKARRKQWWRNFLDPAQVELRVQGKELRGLARVVATDTQEFRKAADSTFRRVRGLGRQFGIDYDAEHGLSDAQWEVVATNAAMVKIALG